MTLGNMRAQGVRSLSVRCWLCHHGAVLRADAWSDDVRVPWSGPRMVCTGCGILCADARPNWKERAGPDWLPVATVMKEIVACSPGGRRGDRRRRPGGSIVVIPRRELQRSPRRGGLYEKEPGAIEQFLCGEREHGSRLKLGNRVLDA
jgi:hypothetical protein